MSSSRAPTLLDIAEALDVSRTLVSVCLSGRYKQSNYRISEETAQRVRDYAAEIGYVPNSHARRLRSNELPPIGLLLGHDFSESKSLPGINYAMNLLGDIGRETMTVGYRSSLAKTVERMKGLGIKDIIIFGSTYEAGNSEFVLEQNRRLKPLLKGMNCYVVDYNFGMPDERFVLDMYRFGINRTHCLESFFKAYQKAGINNFMSIEWHPTDTLLKKGYFQSEEQIFRYIIESKKNYFSSKIQIGKKLAEHFLRIRDKYQIRMLFAGDDFLGGVIQRIFLENGCKIPQELDLIGFDNLEISECFPVTLTSFGVPIMQHVEMAIEHITGKKEIEKINISAPSLTWRESSSLPEKERNWLEKELLINKCVKNVV